MPIFLKDNINNTFTNLRLEFVEFNLTTRENLNRYFLVFEDKTLAIDELENQPIIKIYFADATQEMVVLNLTIQHINSIKI